MDFDPLSLFTAPESREDSIETHNTLVSIPKEELECPKVTLEIPQDSDAHLHPLHTLDLPLLQLQPPANVLLTVLLLLSPNEVCNFSPYEKSTTEEKEELLTIFQDKGVLELVDDAMQWLQVYCPRFDSKLKLSYLLSLGESLKTQQEYNSYLTRLISSDLSWINDDQQELIRNQTSLRISETCGRTAQPEIVRKIAIENLDRFIYLKEPSLTSDNLGLKTWGSSLILGSRLVKVANLGVGNVSQETLPPTHPLLSGNVLELGSGTGLVGMTCSILGFPTTLTDLAEIVPNLQENVTLNNIEANVLELNWCDPSSFIKKYGNIDFQTIVVSDPIYSSQHPYWVINMVDQFLEHGMSARVLIQLPLRPSYENERALLWSLFEKHNFLQVQHEIEDGFDDFGEMKFCFKMYIRDTKGDV